MAEPTPADPRTAPGVPYERPDPVAPPIEDPPRLPPPLGMGCAPLGELVRAVPEREAAATLDAAWEAGVRYYDTAPWYGHGLSEHRLGALLRSHPRGESYVSTKVGRVYEPAPRGRDARVHWAGGLNFALRFDYTAEGFERSLAQSRLRLGQPSVDALVIHDLDRAYHGEGRDRHVRDLTDSGLGWLHALRDRGEIGAVGMGINALEDFAEFADWIEVDFFLVAMPYTLLDQASLHGPMARCRERGIRVVVGAPFASGLLTDPLNASATYDYGPAPDAVRDRARRIGATCGRFGVSLIAAALRFPALHPAVVSVVPGADRPEHARGNAEAFARPIPAELWDALKAEGLIDPDAPTNDGGAS